jgi:outer membrane protein assembly factor BamB
MLKGVSKAKVPDKPQLLWSFKTSDAIKAAPVVCNNTIVVGSMDGNVYGLSLEGKMKWKINTESSIEAPALIVENVAYVGNLQGKLFAVELNSGRLKWSYSTENMIMGSPNYYSDGKKKIIIVGSYDYFLHGVDAETGKGLWKYEADNFINGTPAIYEGKAVFGGCDGFLHIVNVTNGEMINKFEIATYVASSAAIADRTAFVGDYDGGFSALDLNTHKAKWIFTNEKSKLPFISAASVDGNRVFIGNRDKYMYCLDKLTGEVLWSVNTGSRVDASPVVTSKGVLVVNMRGDICLYDVRDGSIGWNYELGIPLSGSPALIDNYIIVGAEDGNVYCFGNKNI